MGTFLQQETRRDISDPVPSTGGGTYAINYIDVTATTLIKAIPRTSSSKRTNAQIDIEIERFTSNIGASAGEFGRIVRALQTNVNLEENQVLVLGGFRRDDNNESITRTPLLERIPLIGWLFKKRDKNRGNTTILIFLRTIIIDPRNDAEFVQYSKGRYGEVVRKFDDDLFGSPYDPVDRIYFKNNDDLKEELISILTKLINSHGKFPFHQLLYAHSRLGE